MNVEPLAQLAENRIRFVLVKGSKDRKTAGAETRAPFLWKISSRGGQRTKNRKLSAQSLTGEC
jgi:hypothetical protein